jgi:CubicO group peptidase (beta-lactamase class C family)
MSDNLERMKGFVERYVPEFMREGKIPGFSIAVVKEGEVVYAEGYGVRDVSRSMPATPDTLYGIGSCTKSFVALAIMQLAEKGKLELDDPVSDYVPLKIGVEGKPITIHHLLSHSSGIPSLATSTISLWRGVGLDLGVPWGTVDDFYRFVNGAQDEVADEPGRRLFYFNAGYRLLGHIIQEKSGIPFHVYVTENILKPLGMTRSTLVKAEYERDADRMTAYWKKPDGSLTPTPFPYPNVEDNLPFSFIAAAGGIMAPVTELTNYLTATMDGGAYGGKRIASPESIEKMITPHISYAMTHYGRSGYGYGWSVVDDFLGHKMVSHGGSILVSTSYLAFLPKLKIGVAMAANTSQPPFAMIAEGVFASLLGKDPEELPALRLREHMRRLIGTYEVYRGLERVRVLNRSGALYLEQKDPFTDAILPLIPDDQSPITTKYYTLVEGLRQPVEFVVHSEDRIDLFWERYRYHKTRV